MKRLGALSHLALPRRLAAGLAIGVGRAVSTVAAEGEARSNNTLLVAFANLGDQLQMLSVYSRFASGGTALDVACNSSTKLAFDLFQGIGGVRAFGAQGAASLPEALTRITIREKPYRRALVPHPFITQPIAMAFARTHAAQVIAMHGPSPRGDVSTPLSRMSWRDAYERFFSECYPGVEPCPTPALNNVPHYKGATTRTIVMHPLSSKRSTMLRPEQYTDLAVRLRSLGFDLIAVGGRTEKTDLARIFGPVQARLVCGAPLREVASLLIEARMFVGIDSSIMHLADAVGTPSVVIYLGTHPSINGPFYTRFVPVLPQSRYMPVGVEPEVAWEAADDLTAEIEIADVVGAVRCLTG